MVLELAAEILVERLPDGYLSRRRGFCDPYISDSRIACDQRGRFAKWTVGKSKEFCRSLSTLSRREMDKSSLDSIRQLGSLIDQVYTSPIPFDSSTVWTLQINTLTLFWIQLCGWISESVPKNPDSSFLLYSQVSVFTDKVLRVDYEV